jgi:hypothetical protein
MLNYAMEGCAVTHERPTRATVSQRILRQSPAQRLAYAQGVIDLAAAARRSRNGDR